VTALLSAFGTVVFRNVVAPRAFPRMPPDVVVALKRRLLVVAQVSVAAALAGLFGWLVVQAATMADTGSVSEAFAAAPTVLRKTSFGHTVAAQIATLVVLAAVLGWRDRVPRPRVALGVATIAVCLQAGHSHAYSMYEGPSVLLGFDILHLLAAGAWLGGLVPLLLTVRAAPPRAGMAAARWFSPLGKLCVGALFVSAAYQGWLLVGTGPGLVGTAYGWMALVKLVLFGVLVCFACANRYRFAPALRGDDPEAAKLVLVRSIFFQTLFGIAIVVAAVVLSDLPPAMHVQPMWPFAKRFSLAAVQEDVDFRREVVQAAVALAGGVGLVIVALIVRRFRIAAGVVALGIAWFAVPHFDLVLAAAYPTSFYHSPTGFGSETIVEGRGLYAQNCVTCHGAGGRGDGPAAQGLPVPPANLTATHLWMHSDGELFWWVSHGMQTPEGKPAMPGFASVLDDDQVWAVIDYIRAHNEGQMQREMGQWMPPVKAPALQASCGDDTVKLSDMRGRFVRLVIGGAASKVLDGPGDDVTIAAPAGVGAVASGVCVTRDENVPLAYAIVSGADDAAIAGTQFLIDDKGWLRAVQRPDAAPGWDKPGALAAEIKTLRAHPVAAGTLAGGDDGDQMGMKM
jgi:putative copper export protein/mono/diheme cytochrome c family protein